MTQLKNIALLVSVLFCFVEPVEAESDFSWLGQDFVLVPTETTNETTTYTIKTTAKLPQNYRKTTAIKTEEPDPTPTNHIHKPKVDTPKPSNQSHVNHMSDCSIAYQIDDWDANIAYAICMGESSGRSEATNMKDRFGRWTATEPCVGSYGLFQIGCPWAQVYGVDADDLFDPQINLVVAYNIHKRSDSWTAWSAYKNGSYKKFLD